jgi:putative NIF3 family GTP cyclohydrolase 1 type 2
MGKTFGVAEIFAILKKQWIWILIISIAVGGIAFSYFNFFVERTYTSSIVIYVCRKGEVTYSDQLLSKELSSKKTLVYNENKKVSRVASYCGAGGDDEGLRFALSMGADAMISSDFKHHVIAGAVEAGLAVIVLTHYASEHYGFKKYYEKFIGQTEVECEFFTDESLL